MKNAYGAEVGQRSPSAYAGGVPTPAPYRYIGVEETKMYSCKECGAAFAKPIQLAAHVRNNHKKQVP